ncbi:hypothetical protein GF406_19165 [candidate division KSB1 bacterium]|nr:hypothetical protein [candidate division KSB1 bacterium]
MKPQGPFDGEALEFNSFWINENYSARQKRIQPFWEMANDIWPKVAFEQVDARQRMAYFFNDE